MESGRATMQDVAERAGVSLSTVSFALNNTRPVAAETRERIERAMADLGYRRNMLARGLASRQSHMLALAFPVTSRGMGATAMEFVEAAASTARELGYQLFMLPLDGRDATTITEAFRHGICDGVLLMEVYLDDDRVRELREDGDPYLLIGRTSEANVPDHIDIDFEGTAHEAVEYLARLGHRDIGFISHSEASFAAGYGPTVRMSAGMAAAARAHDVTLTPVFCDDSAAAGRKAVVALMRAEPAPSALVVMNDDAIFGVLAELAVRGLDVPGDISVLSVVSSPGLGDKAHPRLTTMLFPGARLGDLSIRALVAKLEGREPSSEVLLACPLFEGDSVGPPPRKAHEKKKGTQ